MRLIDSSECIFWTTEAPLRSARGQRWDRAGDGKRETLAKR